MLDVLYNINSCKSGSWIRTGKKGFGFKAGSGSWLFLKIYRIFNIFYFAYFYAKTYRTIQKSGHFLNLSFLIVQILILRVQLFLQFLADALRLGSGSVDSHTFGDPDPNSGSQNFADLTDPDPKHWYIVLYNFKTECTLCCATLKLNVYIVLYNIKTKFVLCCTRLKLNVYCIVQQH